jgi:hypothetical protein
MKNILFFVLLCSSLSSVGQTFLIKEGKLTETTADSTLDYGSPLPHFYWKIAWYRSGEDRALYQLIQGKQITYPMVLGRL